MRYNVHYNDQTNEQNGQKPETIGQVFFDVMKSFNNAIK